MIYCMYDLSSESRVVVVVAFPDPAVSSKQRLVFI